jgi:hephaestin
LIKGLSGTVQVINENVSPLLPETLAALDVNGTAGLSPDDFNESNLKHSINGFIFCNTPSLHMNLGTT